MNIALLVFVLVQDPAPCSKDKTGVAWVHPFTDAQKAARDRGRLLLIKPIAFGTDKAGGW